MSLATENTEYTQRKIAHCDCDCFYAAIEVRDNPSLKGKPVAVGGASRQRGVLTTCSYEARSYGVRSAMPTAHALRLCPDLIVLPVAMDKYKIASAQVREIFLDYTDLVEPLSLDEAFLDLSQSPHFSGSATRIAQAIRERVRKEVGITISAGVAPNKFLAKIASDWQKPDGLTVIRPEQVAQFIASLPVEKLFGVGKVTSEKMHRLGIRSCEDMQAFSLLEMDRKFGRFGARLYELCRGIDERPVSTHRERKSLSVEHTLQDDLTTEQACQDYLQSMLEELLRRLGRQKQLAPIHKVFVKLRFNDFSRTTAEARSDCVDDKLLAELMHTAWKRKDLPVRLVGVGVRFRPVAMEQMDLF